MAKKGKRGIYITGVNALSDRLKENVSMDEVKKIVKRNTLELETGMKRKAQFKGHYDYKKRFVSPTGQTRRSITATLDRNGMQGKVMPMTEYAFYLEYGTRYMKSPQPFVGPAFRQQKSIFLSDMKGLMK